MKRRLAQKKARIGLIGFGLHCQRVYWRCLTKISSECQNNGIDLQIPVLIDVADKQDDIQQFLRAQSPTHHHIIPQQCIYLSPAQATASSTQLHSTLRSQLQSLDIDAFIISTDPRFRRPYIEYAIEHNIKVLCDKPLIVPDPAHHNLSTDVQSSNAWLSQYTDICDLLQTQKQKTSETDNALDVILICQRRRHRAHQFVTHYLQQFISEFQIPMNFIHIQHADGLFLTPNEYHSLENHPFKYGYGKLVNSGYHFIDLLLWYQSVGDQALMQNHKKADLVELSGNCRYSVYDDYHSLNYGDLRRLHQNSNVNEKMLLAKDEQAFQCRDDALSLHSFGELDSYNLMQFKNSHTQNVITTASVQLLHKSFSKRSWVDLPRDLNKQNGRLRHEMLTINVGPLLTIHIRSLQSYEDQKPHTNEDAAEVRQFDVGGANHFEVEIFRNAQLCGGRTLERFDFGAQHAYGEFESLMAESRYHVLSDFVQDRNVSDMSILSKNANDTVKIISAIYENTARHNQHQNSCQSIPLT